MFHLPTDAPCARSGATANRAQADALEIECRAQIRLADEYDAAQERGEVATGRDGPGAGISDGKAKATVADIGLLLEVFLRNVGNTEGGVHLVAGHARIGSGLLAGQNFGGAVPTNVQFLRGEKPGAGRLRSSCCVDRDQGGRRAEMLN